MGIHVLVVEDDEKIGESLEQALKIGGALRHQGPQRRGCVLTLPLLNVMHGHSVTRSYWPGPLAGFLRASSS